MEDWTLEPEQLNDLRRILSWCGEDGVTHALVQDNSAIGYELLGKLWVEIAPF